LAFDFKNRAKKLAIKNCATISDLFVLN